MAASEMDFRGHLHLPLGQDDATAFKPDKAQALYKNNGAGDGGWYPVGANQTWHNGIHLGASQGAPVRSIARGRLIAARLGSDYSTDKYPFGSPRFALVKHSMDLLKNPEEPDPAKWQTRPIEFYSLYMHLDCQPAEMTDVPWLQSFLPFLSRDTPLSGALARIDVEEDVPPGGEKKTGLNCRKAPTLSGSKWIKGELVECLPKGTIVERTANRKGHFQEVNVPSKQLTSVWVYDAGSRLEDIPSFTEQLKALTEGGCAKLDYPIQAGEILGHAGLVKPALIEALSFLADYGIHLEVFSASNLIDAKDLDGWSVLEDDTDDDALCEYKALLEKMDDPGIFEWMGWDTSSFVDFEEVADYVHSLGDDERQRLRKCITRNTSYWSIDWKKLLVAEWEGARGHQTRRHRHWQQGEGLCL